MAWPRLRCDASREEQEVRAPTNGRSSDARREGDGGRTVSAYFDAFAPARAWDGLVRRPPDVFALTNLMLDHTEGYRFAVAPPAEGRWPRTGEAWELCEALLTLQSTADEACVDVASRGRLASPLSFEGRAWRLLHAQGSLSRLSPTRVRIVPKTHFSTRGITIRSLSRYLALCYESVGVRRRSVQHEPSTARGPCSRGAPAPPTGSRQHASGQGKRARTSSRRPRFGSFEFAPEQPLDTDLVDGLLDRAGWVDAVVFPEGAIRHRRGTRRELDLADAARTARPERDHPRARHPRRPGEGDHAADRGDRGQGLWTTDGRSHDDVPGLVLTGVRQLRAPAPRRAGEVSGRGVARV